MNFKDWGLPGAVLVFIALLLVLQKTGLLQPRRNGEKSGERSVNEWEGRIRDIIREELKEFMKERDYHIREIIRQELNRK